MVGQGWIERELWLPAAIEGAVLVIGLLWLYVRLDGRISRIEGFLEGFFKSRPKGKKGGEEE